MEGVLEMKKTKIISALLAGTMMMSAMGTSIPASAASAEGKVLNIYCWNDEFKEMYEKYASDITDDAGIKVNWISYSTADGLYMSKLDSALITSSKLSADKKIDLFLVEPDYSIKYTDSDYVIPVSNLGITEKDLANQYDYTKDLVRNNNNGKVMGVTLNNCSGVFMYRRSIAKKVLESDDPATVQKYVKNWETFDKTAAKMSKKGYYMTACSSDTYRLFSQNSAKPWVKKNKITVGDQRDLWVSQMWKYNKNDYSYMADMWSNEYMEQMKKDGVTFGFFFPEWGVDWIVGSNSEDAYGDYAICQGPAPYYWGGYWLCAATGTDNKKTIGKIMKRLTCNSNTMYKIARDNNIPVNNTIAMKKLAKTSSLKSDLLGKQNPFGIYHKSALNISINKRTIYDQYLDEQFINNMLYYINGEFSKKESLDQFYDHAIEGYPGLKK